MKILKTFVFFSDTAPSHIFSVDTIEYQGSFWLVPEWIDNPEQRWTMPARIICLDGLIHQRTSWESGEFVLNGGIPKDVFDGQIPPGDKYVVIERPNIRIPYPTDV